jgi:1,2-diacylglycerol 3-beta-galactosyltransferase
MDPMDHKRILILYAAAGFGHRSAALAIHAAMQERYGSHCTIDMVNALEDERTPAVLRDSQSDYDKIVRNMPELYKMGYEASDANLTRTMMEGGLTLMLYDVMRDLVKRYQPNVIVSTYPLYQAPLDALFTVEGTSIPMVVSITDLVSVHRIWFNVGVDYSLVPTQEVRRLALNDGLQEEKVILTGIPVSPQIVREQRSKAELQAEFGLDPNRYTFLVAGSKRVDGLPEILSGLNHSGLPVQLMLVAGGDDDLLERFKSEEWHIPVKYFNYVDFMPALMRVSDVNICKAGGLTVSESLACGLPMILVNVLPGQEAGNAEYVLQNQAGIIARDPLALLEASAHWLENGAELLHATSEAAARIGHPQAAYQAAEIVWQAANCEPSARKVTHLFERAKLTRTLKRYRENFTDWASDRNA